MDPALRDALRSLKRKGVDMDGPTVEPLPAQIDPAPSDPYERFWDEIAGRMYYASSKYRMGLAKRQ